MRYIYFLLVITIAGCNSDGRQKDSDTKTGNAGVKTEADPSDTSDPKTDGAKSSQFLPKIYSNERFKDVRAEKTGEHTFLVTGKGQIFEANFSWVVEDGHEELKQGFQMTDAGAPEWGNFSFTVDVPKKRPNSTLHLVLFESSAKDGSRQYELPIPLY